MPSDGNSGLSYGIEYSVYRAEFWGVLCVSMGHSFCNLGRLMRGNPTLSLIVRVAEALDMPPHELLRQLLTDD